MNYPSQSHLKVMAKIRRKMNDNQRALKILSRAGYDKAMVVKVEATDDRITEIIFIDSSGHHAVTHRGIVEYQDDNAILAVEEFA